jgi:hypothetical protein
MSTLRNSLYPIITGGSVRDNESRWLDLGVNAKEFGAIGDGSSHPLSSIYANLAAAQVDYSFVDELTLEVDGVAIQAANDWMWENLPRERKLWAPSGVYKCSIPVFIDPAGHMRGSHSKWAIGTTYASGNVVTWNGIPWRSLSSGNVGNKPFVARGLGDGANAGEVVVYRNQYYRALIDGAQWWALIGFTEPFDAAPDDVTWELAAPDLYWEPYYDQPTEWSHGFTFAGGDGVPSAGSNLGSVFEFGITSMCFVGSPGNGILWDGIQIKGIRDTSAWGYRKGLPAGGIGFAQAGGSGGASRTHWRNCEVSGLRTLWKTGFNSDALCDSNTWEKCNGFNGYIGVHISQSQNFINKIDGCSISATRGVVTEVGGGAHIHGGNPSTVDSVSAALAISNVSALTVVGTGNQYNYSLTAEVVPDTYLRAGVYEYAFIRTARFGVIPFSITAFDEDTGIISLEAISEHTNFFFGGQNPDTTTDLEAELQAPAGDLLYVAEVITVASGSSVTLEKVHIENATAPTCLINNTRGGSNASNSVRNVIFNYDPGLQYYRPSQNPSAANLAKYYAAMTLPFINMDGIDCELSDSYMGMTNDPCLISFSDSSTKLTIRNVKAFRPNVIVGGNGGIDFYNGRNDWGSANLGGKFVSDETPFISWNTSDQDSYRRTGWNASPFWGFRPAGYAVPMVTSAQLTALQSLPAITYQAHLKGGLGSTYGANLSATGSGYSANDVLTLVGGTFSQAAQITVYAVDGSGHITAWYTSREGTYTVAPTSFTVTGGTGSGATFNLPQWDVDYSAPYPALWGGQLYRVADWDGVAPAKYQFTSAHKFYSLGQDLTTSNMPKCAYSFKGKSFAVYCDEEVMGPLWAGQDVKLGSGTPTQLYIVTGKMPGLGYFTVGKTDDYGDDTHLVGDKNTVFSGTIIGQAAYSITTI